MNISLDLMSVCEEYLKMTCHFYRICSIQKFSEIIQTSIYLEYYYSLFVGLEYMLFK